MFCKVKEEENASLDEGSSSDDIVDDTDEDPDFHPSNPDRERPFSLLGPWKTLDFTKPSTSTDPSLLPPQEVTSICDTDQPEHNRPTASVVLPLGQHHNQPEASQTDYMGLGL